MCRPPRKQLARPQELASDPPTQEALEAQNTHRSPVVCICYDTMYCCGATLVFLLKDTEHKRFTSPLAVQATTQIPSVKTVFFLLAT